MMSPCDTSVTAEAFQYPATPYLRPCALRNAMSGASGCGARGWTAAVASGTSVSTTAAASAGHARRPARMPSRTSMLSRARPRAASTAPAGSTKTISRGLLITGNVENRYPAMFSTIATHSSCSARVALVQVTTTRPKP